MHASPRAIYAGEESTDDRNPDRLGAGGPVPLLAAPRLPVPRLPGRRAGAVTGRWYLAGTITISAGILTVDSWTDTASVIRQNWLRRLLSGLRAGQL